jgi:protein TonB
MSHATVSLSLMENNQRNNDFMLIALLLSVALHSGIIGFLPGFGQSPERIDPPLIVEMLTPEPPPPIKEPEPPKPEPVKPVPPPPKPLPIQKTMPPEPPPVVTPTPRAETPPPLAETPRPVEPSPPPVIAVEQKSSEPPPVFTAPTPVPVPVAPPSIEDTEEDPDGFGRAMTGEFKKNVKYPQVAIMRGWEGVVKVTLHIDAEGNITDITIKQKSGKDTLDEAALKTARKTKLLPIPPSRRGKPFTLTVPISYSLKSS